MKIIQLTNMTPYQTMGYVIAADSGEVLVVDGGHDGNGNELKRIVKSLGGKVDLWLITHPHCDHFRAPIEVIKNPEGIAYKALGASVLSNNWAESLDCEDKVEVLEWNEFVCSLDSRFFEIKEGQIFNLGSMQVEVLADANPDLTKNAINNQSCVFKITEGDFSLLVLGDLGAAASDRLMASGKDISATAVQLSHHGQGGSPERLYKAISPKFAFWPTPKWLWNNEAYLGDGNPDTGPFTTRETQKWMENLGVTNITSFTHTTVFDTKTLKIEEY